jgi:hypothetical protein
LPSKSSMIVKMNKTNVTDNLSTPELLEKMDAFWRAANSAGHGRWRRPANGEFPFPQVASGA